MAVDGYLNFDTKINQKGFAKGLASIGKSVTGWATSVVSTINRVTAAFSKITEAYNTQIEAEARLAATMKNSTGASQKEIQSVKDLAGSLQELGVVGDEVQLAGAQELATYVGTTESIKKMLPVLNDMVAQQYGFSASTDSAVTIATMLGKVLQGQTSALSRYGYSFDENQEKLLKFGTEEQRVATLAAVVEESVAGVNEALANTPTGRVKQLSNDFGDLKETFGKLLSEIVYPLVTYLDVIVKKLNSTFSAASGGIKALFGITDDNVSFGGGSSDLADSSADAAENYADIADSAKKAEKANKGSLAPFDELNVLSQDTADNTSESAADTVPETLAEAVAPEVKTVEFEQKVDAVIEAVKAKFAEMQEVVGKTAQFFTPVANAVEKNLGAALTNAKNGISGYIEAYSDEVGEYTSRIRSSLSSAAEHARNGIVNILAESAKSQERMGAELSQGYTDILGGASVFALSYADVYAGMFDIIGQSFEDFTVTNSDVIGGFFDGLNGTFANLLTTVGTILEDIGTRLTEWWDGTGAAAFKNFTDAIFDVGAVILDIWQSYVLPFVNYVIDSVAQLWDEHLAPLWSGVLDLLSSLWDAVAAIWNRLLRPLYDTFIKRIMVGVMGALKSVWDIAYGLFAAVVDIVKGVVRVAKGLLDFITGVFTGDLDKAFDGINDMFCGLIDAIWGAFKGVLNTIIGAMNTVWSAIYGVIKSIVDGIGDFVGMIGDLSGKNWYFSMPDEVPRIPRLAEGTVIPANYGEFAAILGDNKREREFVTPESSMKQAFVEALLEAGLGDSGDTVIQIDGDTIFRITKKHADNYSRTHGGRPAFGAGSAR